MAVDVRQSGGGGSNVGQSFCSTAFMLKGQNREESKRRKQPRLCDRELTASTFICRHTKIIISDVACVATLLPLLSINLQLSHCPDKTMKRAHSPALATVAWIRHVKIT